jgi:hypothetical protein
MQYPRPQILLTSRRARVIRIGRQVQIAADSVTPHQQLRDIPTQSDTFPQLVEYTSAKIDNDEGGMVEERSKDETKRMWGG